VTSIEPIEFFAPRGRFSLERHCGCTVASPVDASLSP
jgi:hypothetical protein